MKTVIVLLAKYLYLVIVLAAGIYFLRQPHDRKKYMVWLGIFALPLTLIIARIAAKFYFDPRPFVTGHFTPLIPHAADNGFPSDHTLLSAALASIIFFFNERLGLLLWVLAVGVGIFRVAAGIHHPVDIAGAMVIAFITTCGAYYFILPRLFRKKRV